MALLAALETATDTLSRTVLTGVRSGGGRIASSGIGDVALGAWRGVCSVCGLPG